MVKGSKESEQYGEGDSIGGEEVSNINNSRVGERGSKVTSPWISK